MGGVTIVHLVIIFLYLGGIGLYVFLLVDSNKSESNWVKETRYYEVLPSIDIPMDYSDDKVEVSSELKSRSNLRCVRCGCIYIPTPNCKSSPTPKYCPECGRKMINWKEIMI